MCQHQPHCPRWQAPDHLAARIVIDHPGQGWCLLCNGVILFDDGGELLPVRHASALDRPGAGLPPTTTCGPISSPTAALTKGHRAQENRAYVRRPLWLRQPASALQDLSPTVCGRRTGTRDSVQTGVTIRRVVRFTARTINRNQFR